MYGIYQENIAKPQAQLNVHKEKSTQHKSLKKYSKWIPMQTKSFLLQSFSVFDKVGKQAAIRK